MEFLIFIIIAITIGGILDSIRNKKKIEKMEATKICFENTNTNCTQIAKMDNYFLYSNIDTKDIFVLDTASNKINCTIKNCGYDKIIEAYPYFLIFDNNNKKIYIISIKELSHNTLNYNNLISIEIIENGQIIFKKSIMRAISGAITGNIIAGGAGAVVGGLSGNTTTHKKIEDIIIKLLVRDTNNPSIELRLEGIFRIEQANKIKDTINVIIDKIDKEFSKETSISIADELIKLNDLKKQGILTEEEFIQQKNKMLKL